MNLTDGIIPCETCEYSDSFPNGDPCPKCIEHIKGTHECRTGKLYKKRIITNAMKIRAMTDEELAEWYFNSFFPKAPYCNKEECFEDSPCEKCLLDWLKQETNDELQ